MTAQPELRDLIDQLTSNHTRAVFRNHEFIWNRPERPLLHLLAEARTEDLGRGNGTTAAHERVTLNTAASHLHGVITHRLRSWLHEARITPTRTQLTDPAALLTTWWARNYINPPPAREHHIRTWTTQIVDLCVDPPRRRIIEAPCPTCGTRWIAADEEHTESALEALERDPVNDSTAHCRNCDTTWQGVPGIQQLREAIHANDHLAHGIACAGTNEHPDAPALTALPDVREQLEQWKQAA